MIHDFTYIADFFFWKICCTGMFLVCLPDIIHLDIVQLRLSFFDFVLNNKVNNAGVE